MTARHQIIMNFTTPPSAEDLEVIAGAVMEALPEELMEFCDQLDIVIEEIADTAVEEELELEDPYDLPACYRSGKEVAPGVKVKNARRDGALVLYRRPILDMWCEMCEDLSELVRQVMIEELCRQFEFTEDETDEMLARHHQGLL